MCARDASQGAASAPYALAAAQAPQTVNAPHAHALHHRWITERRPPQPQRCKLVRNGLRANLYYDHGVPRPGSVRQATVVVHPLVTYIIALRTHNKVTPATPYTVNAIPWLGWVEHPLDVDALRVGHVLIRFNRHCATDALPAIQCGAVGTSWHIVQYHMHAAAATCCCEAGLCAASRVVRIPGASRQ